MSYRSFTVITLLSSILLVAESKCPTFFEQYNMACYYFGNNAVNSVQQAFQTCYNLGGYLLNINAELEHDHVVNRIQQQPILFDGYWIGGFFDGQNWVWQKTDESGTVVSIYMNPGDQQYNHWGPLQPNAGWPVIRKPFAAIMVRHRPAPYSWYSENGLLNMPGGMSYVCEADWKPDV